MLIHLGVKDLALLEDVSLDFDRGFNVLTGETGAGKSLLLDALGLALGNRANPRLVRQGCEKATVSALFVPQSKTDELNQVLMDWGLDGEEELLLRREIHRNGRSRAWVNGQVTTAGALSQLAPLLGVIHGQHASHTLAQADQHLKLLDLFAGNQELGRTTLKFHGELTEAREAVRSFQNNLQEKELRLSHLNLQLEELTRVSPKLDEEMDLEKEATLLSSGDRLVEAYQGVLDALSAENEQASANELLGQALGHLEEAADFNPALTDWLQQARDARQLFEDLTQAILDASAQTKPDPERLDFVLDRLSKLQEMRRKYGPDMSDVISTWQNLKQEAEALGAGDERLEELNQQLEKNHLAWQESAKKLSKTRRKTSPVFSRQVADHLKQLGMPKARFQVEFEDRNQDHGLGLEKVVFLLSANPGSPLEPVQKVASGGEMSRLMLSILLTLHQSQGSAALVFDEIDAGIGGRTAETVGKGLRDLGIHRQVLCVTHLPQVAAQGNRHISVNKVQLEGDTTISFSPLDQSQREQEIARMLGDGLAETTAREHARALLKSAQTP